MIYKRKFVLSWVRITQSVAQALPFILGLLFVASCLSSLFVSLENPSHLQMSELSCPLFIGCWRAWLYKGLVGDGGSKASQLDPIGAGYLSGAFMGEDRSRDYGPPILWWATDMCEVCSYLSWERQVVNKRRRETWSKIASWLHVGPATREA